jgi:hypothetical protein
VINLRWSLIAAAAAFAVSLVLGISIQARILVVFIRALAVGVLFFFLALLIWRLINRYIPDLLRAPSGDLALMPDLESGSRVNITLGDEAIPRDAALPPEETVDDSVGNIAEMVNRPAPAENPGSPAPVESPGSPGMGEEGPAAPEPLPAFASETPLPMGAPGPAAGQGMDQGSQSGYTGAGKDSGVSPSMRTPAGVFSGLGDTSGGIESLPDLDALAGSFLSSPAAGEDEPVPAPSSSPRPAGGTRSKRGRSVEEDFNPKELASAIQTILKRD